MAQCVCAQFACGMRVRRYVWFGRSQDSLRRTRVVWLGNRYFWPCASKPARLRYPGKGCWPFLWRALFPDDRCAPITIGARSMVRGHPVQDPNPTPSPTLSASGMGHRQATRLHATPGYPITDKRPITRLPTTARLPDYNFPFTARLDSSGQRILK